MNRQEAHDLVDKLYDLEVDPPKTEGTMGTITFETEEPEVAPRVLPEGKRVVRTKTSGDRVYLLDEVKKTRQWLTKPEVLDAQGFTAADVVEVPDDELLKYQMGAAIYKTE